MNQKVSGEERLAAICQALRQETLSPAQQEAESILIAARKDAEIIREEAKKEADELKKHALKEIEKEQTLFQSSLKHAARQTIERLKDKIENKLFNKGLDLLLQEKFPEATLGSVLEALTKMIELSGLTQAPELWVGKHVNLKALLASLSEKTLSKFEEEKIKIGPFSEGFKLQIKDQNMTIEITEESIRDILSSLLRKDFRRYLFKESEEQTEEPKK